MRWVLAAGVLVRVVVMFATEGFGFDQQGFAAAERAFRERGLSAYDGTDDLWPYPPGYFPWLWLAAQVGAYEHTLRLPAILADAVLAWLAADLLRRRGAPERTCVLAAGVLMAAPIVVAHSAHHGQLDSVATAFGLAAVWVWTRPGQQRRALLAGVLIGAGGLVKTVPLLLVLALSPTARSWRERAVLAGTAGGLWVAAMAPFYAATPGSAEFALTYRGVPGFGGISMITQKLDELGLFPTSVWSFLVENSQELMLLPALGVCAVVLHRRRVEAVAAGAAVWLTVYVFGFNFFIHYLVWGLPFALALGRLRAAAIAGFGLFVPLALVVYAKERGDFVVWGLYVVPLTVLWVACAAALTRAARPAPAPSGTPT